MSISDSQAPVNHQAPHGDRHAHRPDADRDRRIATLADLAARARAEERAATEAAGRALIAYDRAGDRAKRAVAHWRSLVAALEASPDLGDGAELDYAPLAEAALPPWDGTRDPCPTLRGLARQHPATGAAQEAA